MGDTSAPLGLFGGTFDPIHFGHLRLAQEALDHLGLSTIRWIPAGQPPHRAAPRVTPQHRLEMARIALADNPAFTVDGAEVDAPVASYTVHTLERLRGELGEQRPLVLLLGADAFAKLTTWHRWLDILQLAHIGVAHRPGFPISSDNLPSELSALFRQRSHNPSGLQHRPAGLISTFAMTQLDISATQIRKLLSNGRPARYLLPNAVLDYIARNHLYEN